MAKTEATIADLYAVGKEDRVELVNGELLPMSPVGTQHQRIAGKIYIALAMYEAQAGTGYAILDNAAYIVNVPWQRSFSPDASYTEGHPLITDKFIDGVPRFAVEIRSPSDYGPRANATYDEKRAAYFAVGTTVVWDVNLREHTVSSYGTNAPDSPTVFHFGETADAEPALPGWRITVDALFDVTKSLP